MGNSQNKLPLRKAQSVPDTQSLAANASFVRAQSRSSQRLFRAGRDGAADRNTSLASTSDAEPGEAEVDSREALFLPDFPLRGEIEEQDFEVVEVLAQGAYGNVLKVQREDEKMFYAMKVLDKDQIIAENAVRQVKDEAAIQSMLGDHPFIVKTHEYWQSHKHLYIVLEYVPHGDMFTLWTFHTVFPERLVRIYIAELAMVLDYLQKSGVIYRDLKMENILFDPRGHIQLTDFGLAKWLTRGDKTRTICGTLQYMAPEILAVYPYGHTADWWSLGILMYALLAGKYPVDGAQNHMEMSQWVMECDYLLPSHVGEKPQDVVNRLLTKSPFRRLTDLFSLQNLPFFKNLNFTDLIERKISPMDVVPADFFPMTGMSWAPYHLNKENTEGFSGFDGCNYMWKLPPDTVAVFV